MTDLDLTVRLWWYKKNALKMGVLYHDFVKLWACATATGVVQLFLFL